MTAARAGLLILLIPTACAGPAPAGPGHERDARFVGEWLVDQPYHALYEATWYTFAADGALVHGASCGVGGPVEGYETGSVARLDPEVQCQFGERWASEGAETLIVEGVCSDGAPRTIALGFPADATGNATGAAVEVLAVGAEDGWAHLDFEWRWTRCTTAESCQPALCSP